MGVLDTLIRKRDAAYAHYQKWQTLLDTLQDDPDFAKALHGRAAAVVNGARARLKAAPPPDQLPDAPPPGYKASWTAARRQAQADRMRNRWQNPMTKKKLLATARAGLKRARKAQRAKRKG